MSYLAIMSPSSFHSKTTNKHRYRLSAKLFTIWRLNVRPQNSDARVHVIKGEISPLRPFEVNYLGSWSFFYLYLFFCWGHLEERRQLPLSRSHQSIYRSGPGQGFQVGPPAQYKEVR